MVGVALAQRAEALLVGVPVQPGGSLVKPHTDSPMVRCSWRGPGRRGRVASSWGFHLEESGPVDGYQQQLLHHVVQC